MTDYRALAWLHLLPPETSLVIPDGPDWLPRLPECRSGGSNVQVLVLSEWDAITHQDLSQYQGIALVSERPLPRIEPEPMGFCFIQRFAVFPGWHEARYFIPLESNRVSAGALCIERPFRSTSRVIHRALRLLLRAGFSSLCRGFLLLALREQSPLEHLVSNLCGSRFHGLALSAGRARDQRKVNAVALAHTGQPIAFLKMATSPSARAALSKEAGALANLGTSPLAGTVPKLMAFHDAPHRSTLVVEAGPDRVAPPRLSKFHYQWLSNLADYTRATKPFAQSQMARDLAENWSVIKDSVQPSWTNRVEQTFYRLNHDLGKLEIPLTMAQGDFAPWNIRQFPDNSIYVFDWELTKPERTPLFDAFHFQFITASLLGKGVRLQDTRRWLSELTPYLPADVDAKLISAFFGAYLLDTAITNLKALAERGETSDDLVLSSIASVLDATDYWWGS